MIKMIFLPDSWRLQVPLSLIFYPISDNNAIYMLTMIKIIVKIIKNMK